MKKNWLYSILMTIPLIGGLTACNNEDDPNPNPYPEPTTTYGAYIVNTGNWGKNDGSIQWFDMEKQTVSGDLYHLPESVGTPGPVTPDAPVEPGPGLNSIPGDAGSLLHHVLLYGVVRVSAALASGPSFHPQHDHEILPVSRTGCGRAFPTGAVPQICSLPAAMPAGCFTAEGHALLSFRPSSPRWLFLSRQLRHSSRPMRSGTGRLFPASAASAGCGRSPAATPADAPHSGPDPGPANCHRPASRPGDHG